MPTSVVPYTAAANVARPAGAVATRTIGGDDGDEQRVEVRAPGGAAWPPRGACGSRSGGHRAVRSARSPGSGGCAPVGCVLGRAAARGRRGARTSARWVKRRGDRTDHEGDERDLHHGRPEDEHEEHDQGEERHRAVDPEVHDAACAAGAAGRAPGAGGGLGSVVTRWSAYRPCRLSPARRGGVSVISCTA